MTYSVYCSNTSDSWNNGTELYNGEHPMDNIYVTVVCRYVIYVPPIINRTSKVDVCEIEISGKCNLIYKQYHFHCVQQYMKQKTWKSIDETNSLCVTCIITIGK